MHDTAFRIGTLAMNIYANLSTANILEIGSHAVNGSLRDNALPTTRYVGVDLEKGDGVDLVVEPGKPLPVEDGAFDLVIASSVFEHDPMFWMTFLEMCKKTSEGGYIYINVPSNGAVHRYPQDNWRFYPDSARALVQWVVSQGQHVTLVESFIAGREDDIWNDLVAVFRKGRMTKALPSAFIYEHVTSWNVTTWKSKEIINRRDESEDMVLLAEAVLSRDDAVGQRDALNAELGATRERLAELDRTRKDLIARESELRQREEEIKQTRAELAQIRHERDELAAQFAKARKQVEQEVARRSHVEALRDGFEQVAKQQELLYAERLATAHTRLADAEASARTSEAKLGDRFKEIATLTRLLRQQEQHSVDALGHIAWLRAVSEREVNRPLWWGLMPDEWQRRRERQRLQRSGLFDGAAYLARYPDVAAAEMDPLEHYLLHGLYEGRSRSF